MFLNFQTDYGHGFGFGYLICLIEPAILLVDHLGQAADLTEFNLAHENSTEKSLISQQLKYLKPKEMKSNFSVKAWAAFIAWSRRFDSMPSSSPMIDPSHWSILPAKMDSCLRNASTSAGQKFPPSEKSLQGEIHRYNIDT